MKRTSVILMSMVLAVLGVQAQHKLGDIVDFGGVKGMVFQVDATGEHGLAMSVDKCSENWLADKEAKYETGAFYEDDGSKNLQAIERYIGENGQQWTDFPYFNWCRELGEGWYPPANDELTALIKFINGGEGLKFNGKNAKKVHQALKKAGGKGIYDGFTKSPYLYFSSTEGDGGMVYVMQFQESAASSVAGKLASGLSTPLPKGTYKLQPWLKSQMGGKFLNIVGSRAVHKF